MKIIGYFIIFLLAISCKSDKSNLNVIEGAAIGTTYSIKYISNDTINFTYKIDSIVMAVNKSLSTYIPTSDISKINDGDTSIVVDHLFVAVFNKSKKIFDETSGEFDPTVGILVNAWGFGPENEIPNLEDTKVKELMQFVGYNKVQLINGKIYKESPQIYFDFNAIAKGYLVDLVGELLEKHTISNYLVEIGGEIRARGTNQNGEAWRIAIEDPNTDGSRSFATTLQLKNEAMATSGNYRKFKIAEDGKKYVHTINALTGFATESNLLSASVITLDECAFADGYATAFMAMGLEKTKTFLELHPEIKVYLIYSNSKGEIETFKTGNFNN
ncbi:FAD:protein FMN transferase [Lutibacter sp.]|uniref:FAD:protein FMN transferase n=1 Tax=Lutibacter sp. TaxID=1925666 RepID=UPI0027323AA8|nr:FAD:protein FMN transferase [Lutibacter sp.]MDP3314252.1 FAD:protein FMN transferase [Lutibacter sp.]